jgi:Predicted multitransmembrane protein
MREKQIRFGRIFPILLFMALIIALVSVPTGFSRSIYLNATGAKVRILSVDDSAVLNIGLFRQGEQKCGIKVLSGPHKGLELEAVNMLSGSLENDKMFTSGDAAWALIERDENDEVVFVNLIDHYRLNAEILFALLFALALLLFAGKAGIRILLSLICSFLVILKFLVPAFLKGWPPVMTAALALAVMALVTLYMVSGLNRRSTAAVLGSVCSFVLAFALAAISVKVFRIHGSVMNMGESLLYSGFQNLDLTSIFTAVVALSSCGAVMDLSIDVSAAMWEVVTANPSATGREIFSSGMNVGRAGVGTQMTTLVLAYTGSAVTVFMVYMAQGTPILNILNSKAVAAELVQSLAGCLSLLAVSPLTAFFGAKLFKKPE